MAKKPTKETLEDDGFFDVEVLARHVFHDGTSMIVLKPGNPVRIDRKFIASLVEDGIIEKPTGFAGTFDEQQSDNAATTEKAPA